MMEIKRAAYRRYERVVLRNTLIGQCFVFDLYCEDPSVFMRISHGTDARAECVRLDNGMRHIFGRDEHVYPVFVSASWDVYYVP